MTQCRIGSHVTTVDSVEDCRAAGGTPVSGDGGTGGTTTSGGCFAPMVLGRAFGDALHQLGASSQVSADLAVTLDLNAPRLPARKKRPSIVPLTAAKRRALAATASRSILTVGATFPVALEFQERLLATTARGRRLMAQRGFLKDMYDVASRDLRVAWALGRAWLAVYPFGAAMVAAASASDTARPATHGVRFTKQHATMCRSVIRLFHAGSENKAFHAFLSGLEEELSGYVGRTAAEAVDKLRTTQV